MTFAQDPPLSPRTLSALAAIALLLGIPSLCYGGVVCTTTGTTFTPAAGCNTDINGDNVLEHHASCTCTKYVKTCSNGVNSRWITCVPGLLANKPPSSRVVFDNIPRIPTFFPPDPPPFVPASPQGASSPSGNGKGASGLANKSINNPNPPPRTQTRTLKCQEGFATLYDAAGKPLEPVSPCFGGNWTVPLKPGEPTSP